MNPRLFRLSVLSAALFSGHAAAVGFGEIVLLSRVGEPLRAEVPLLAGAGEQIDTACFSLATLPGSDLPVVSSGRIRLARDGQNYRLFITGTKPIAEPIFVIALRANCGIELQRDFVLMPPAPLMLAAADGYGQAPTAAVVSKKTANFQEIRAREGDTLESIAEAQATGNLVEQRRLLTAMKRANPGLSAEQPLSEDTAVRIPKLRKSYAAESAEHAEPPPVTQRREAPPPRPRKAAPPPEVRPAPSANTQDRLVLGAPPAEATAGEKPVAQRGTQSEMDERMLKLETTLNLLNQEVEKLNNALTLTTEALAVQNKLQNAQALQAEAASAPAAIKVIAPAPLPAERTSQSNWLELLLSALVGGGIAAGLAHLLARRATRNANAEMPLAVNGYRHEVVPHLAPTAPPTPAGKAAPAPSLSSGEVDIPLDFSDKKAVDVDFDDGNSALELAEIMLSFGRIHGAAETLAQHIEENAPDNIQPWSMLLDLYRRGDMRAEFETLATRMRNKFNVHVNAWEDSSTPVSGLKSLEDYAHVVWRINHSWGTQDCLDYLFDLVHDNRAGTRGGFPLEVVEEIALLMRVLEEGYGLRRRG